MEQGFRPTYSRKSAADNQVELKCETIVDAGIWEQRQERLAENKQT